MPDRGCGIPTLIVLALIFLTGGMIIPIVVIGFIIFWALSMLDIIFNDNNKNNKDNFKL